MIADANLLTLLRSEKKHLMDRYGVETIESQESMIAKRLRRAQMEIKALVCPEKALDGMPSFIELIDEGGTVYRKREVKFNSVAG